MQKLILLIILLFSPFSARALNVFVCEPEWGALAMELAGDRVELTIATTAFQDPHRLQARPSLIAAVRRADLVICTGADLEIGWLPLLLRRASNPKVRAGGGGNFLAADFVRRLEIPRTIDRSQGDIHPQGNPHIHLDARNISRVSAALADRLAELDSANAAEYRSRLEDFQRRWGEAILRWENRAAGLRGLRLASHHRSFSYLAAWLDLDIVATLEPRPGIPASGAQLAALLEQLTGNPPVGVIRAPYENEKPSLWLSERLGMPAVMLPYTVGGNPAATDLFALFDETLRMLEALRP